VLRNTIIYPNLSSPGQKDTYVTRDKELFPRTTLLKGNVIKSIIFVIKSKKKKKKKYATFESFTFEDISNLNRDNDAIIKDSLSSNYQKLLLYI